MDELTGTVRTFDTARGYGSVESDDGRSWFFHCTQIADGSRTIDVGARVRFGVEAGRMGRWEAARLTAIAS
jgi:CspA family cold shock protein